MDRPTPAAEPASSLRMLDVEDERIRFDSETGRYIFEQSEQEIEAPVMAGPPPPVRTSTQSQSKVSPVPKNSLSLESEPVQYDPVTGRYIFQLTEEEKRIEQAIKAGPPKLSELQARAAVGCTAANPPYQYVDVFNSS